MMFLLVWNVSQLPYSVPVIGPCTPLPILCVCMSFCTPIQGQLYVMDFKREHYWGKMTALLLALSLENELLQVGSGVSQRLAFLNTLKCFIQRFILLVWFVWADAISAIQIEAPNQHTKMAEKCKFWSFWNLKLEIHQHQKEIYQKYKTVWESCHVLNACTDCLLNIVLF